MKNVKYIDDNKQGTLRIYYKYDEQRVCAIEGLKRVSLTSRRVYVPKDKIPRVMGGFGIADHLDLEGAHDGQGVPRSRRRRRGSLPYLVTGRAPAGRGDRLPGV